jgi:hypothetical protein
MCKIDSTKSFASDSQNVQNPEQSIHPHHKARLVHKPNKRPPTLALQTSLSISSLVGLPNIILENCPISTFPPIPGCKTLTINPKPYLYITNPKTQNCKP